MIVSTKAEVTGKAKKGYAGSSLEDFLREENIYDEVNEIALKRVITWQVAQEMKNQKLSKVALAKKMHTSRTVIDRALDPENTSVTLNTLIKIADAIGKKLKIEFV